VSYNSNKTTTMSARTDSVTSVTFENDLTKQATGLSHRNDFNAPCPSQLQSHDQVVIKDDGHFPHQLL